MNARQERFVAEYLVDLNATQAAIRAGYSPHTAGVQGHELLKKPEIALRVSSRQIATLEKAAGSADWIVEQAVRVVRYALDDDPHDLRAAVPALALLARRHPEFNDKHEVNVDARVQAMLLIAEMPAEQRRALAERAHADTDA